MAASLDASCPPAVRRGPAWTRSGAAELSSCIIRTPTRLGNCSPLVRILSAAPADFQEDSSEAITPRRPFRLTFLCACNLLCSTSLRESDPCKSSTEPEQAQEKIEDEEQPYKNQNHQEPHSTATAEKTAQEAGVAAWDPTEQILFAPARLTRRPSVQALHKKKALRVHAWPRTPSANQNGEPGGSPF
jgi:hypothetical protein